MTYKLTLTVDCGRLGENEIEFEVKFTPATPDVMYLPNGDPGYPGDPAELEVLKAFCKGVDITAAFAFEDDEKLYDELCTEAWEVIEDAHAAAKEDWQRDRAQAREDWK